MRHLIQLLYAVFLLFADITSLKAQQATTATGGNATGSGGSMNYSVGQIVYITNAGTGGTVSQGVQQPYDISVVSGIEEIGINLSYTVYPNPTTENVVLQIDGASQTNEITSNETLCRASLRYILHNINGNEILQQTITCNQTIIPMEQYPAGFYFVIVETTSTVETQNFASQTSPKPIKTFKIIKQ